MTLDLLDPHIWYSNDFPWSQDVKFVYIFDENMPLQKLNWAKETMIFFKISKTTEMHKSFFYVGPNSNDNEIWKYGCYVYCRWWAETWVTRGTWFLYMLLLSVLAHFPTIFHSHGQHDWTMSKLLWHFICPIGAASMHILINFWISGIRIIVLQICLA